MLFEALILTLVAVILLLIANHKRSRIKYKYQLQANCLLTKKPLLFVSGPSSLFYFGQQWNSIPDLLREHGYQVEELQLTNSQDPILQLQKANITGKHIIASRGLNINFKKLSNISLTLIEDSRLQLPKTRRSIWNLLIGLHNLTTGQSIRPEVYAIANTKNIQQIAKSYVHLAILLAESEH